MYREWLLFASFAAQNPTWEKLRQVPNQVWINIALCVLAVIVVVRLWRTLKRLNDYAPYVAAVIAGTVIFLYWVYERTEPRFLTPVVERLTPFLPSKQKQQRDIEQFRRGREI
jgi:hypothetical protein